MRTVLFLLASVVVIGCKDAPPPCEALSSSCACHERSDCKLVTDGCWCPSECDPKIQCVCGGGKFLRCEKAP